ncbi:hypothetical protein FHG87_018449 [Trinorchestia longiramus]|nr:hypothetical protein FHG87_018449 [Trinorchestia longiramus]
MDVVHEQCGENKWNARCVEEDSGLRYLVGPDEESNMTVVDAMKDFLEGDLQGLDSPSMIEHMTCGMWVEMESCKGLTKMSVSEGNPLVLDYCKCMAVVKVKMEEEIENLKAKIVFFLE